MPSVTMITSIPWDKKITGTAISSGGSHMPIYVPSSLAYHDCIRRAYARAGRDPRDVDYYEAHATGTQVGDPIEVNAAGELFATDHECLIGSIKSNIGHMEMAAFLGSLLKVCHIFDKGVIPPHVNVGDPNVNIAWEKYRLRVPTDPVKLPCHSNDGTSVISISSGGHGGSFGHVVLESPPAAPLTAALPVHANTPILYVVGGLSPKAVDELCQNILDPSRLIRNRGSEAVKISRAARQCTWRTYIILPLRAQESIPLPRIIPQALPQIGFVFNGQGVQHMEMGRQLFQTCPIFRQSILEMDDMYRTSTGHSFLESTGLFRLGAKVPELPSLWPVEITLPAIAMLQIALYDTMVDLGLRPGFCIGHSAGETAILYASGAGSKEMVIDLAIARGKSMMCTEMLDGGMASFGCSEGDINPILSTLQQRIRGNELSVACFNSPNSITLAGPSALVDEAIAMAKSHDIFAQRIRTKVPGHSPLMELSKNDYDAFVVDVFSRYPGPHVPRIPVYSTALPGTLIEDFTVDYFWANTRNPVRFSDAINMSLDAQSATPIIVEIGAHPALSVRATSRWPTARA
ncbi:putative PKS/NRPS-like protein biosynthetic cluster [Pleurotus pulmonarius]|nr:putative PKS/NRPS-like protein biosynthetic cluster [Pleurotus pulmonarius]